MAGAKLGQDSSHLQHHHHGHHRGIGLGPLASTANLTNSLLGAGLVALPYCFMASGVLLASLLMIVCILACRFSFSLLLHCRQLSNRQTFEDLAEQAVGPIGRQAVRWCEAMLNLGTTVAYLNILADVLSSVAGTLIPPGAEPSRNTYVAGVAFLGVLIGTLVRDAHTASALSSASVAALVVFALILSAMALSSPTAAGLADLTMWRWKGLLLSFPVLAYGYTAHSDYLGIYADMKRPNISRMLRVTDVALSVSSCLYIVVGISGYAQWQGRTSGDLLRNLGSSRLGSVRGAYERALKACYGLSVLGCIPLMIPPFYVLLLDVPRPGEPPSQSALSLHGPWTWMQLIQAIGTWIAPLPARRYMTSSCRGHKSHSSMDYITQLDDTAAAQAVGTEGGSWSRQNSIQAGEDNLPLLTTTTSSEVQSGWAQPGNRLRGLFSRRGAAGTASARGIPSSGGGGVADSAGLGHRVRRQVSRTATQHGATTAEFDIHRAPSNSLVDMSVSPRPGGQEAVAGASPACQPVTEERAPAATAAAGPLAPSTPSWRPSIAGQDSVAASPLCHKSSTGSMTQQADSPQIGWKDSMAPPAAPAGAVLPYWHTHQPTFWQHTYAVVVVLGCAMLVSIWVPNAEFVMGLTGSTASVMLAYLMPAITLLGISATRPELEGTIGSRLARRQHTAKQQQYGLHKVLPEEVKRQWRWRRRGACALLLFGVVTGLVCTAAVLLAVQQEAEIVALAQELVGVQRVATQTAAAKAKAKQAVATVAAVERAAAQLQVVEAQANSTMTRLQEAAATLSAFTGQSGGAAQGQHVSIQPGSHPPATGAEQPSRDGHLGWSVEAWIAQHQHAVADSNALRGTEAQLHAARMQVAESAADMEKVIDQLDTALAALAADKTQGTAIDADSADAAKQGQSSTNKGGALTRAQQLAEELNHALHRFDAAASSSPVVEGQLASSMTRPLDQVRANAVSTLGALMQTLGVLERVEGTIIAARSARKQDVEIRREAAEAMEAAVRAGTTSSLALTITQQVLRTSASQEADELVATLQQVAADLQQANAKHRAAVMKPVPPPNSPSPAPTPSPPSPSAVVTPSPATLVGAVGQQQVQHIQSQQQAQQQQPTQSDAVIASNAAGSSNAQSSPAVTETATVTITAGHAAGGSSLVSSSTSSSSGTVPTHMDTPAPSPAASSPAPATPSNAGALTSDKLKAIQAAVEQLGRATEVAIQSSKEADSQKQETGQQGSNANRQGNAVQLEGLGVGTSDSKPKRGPEQGDATGSRKIGPLPSTGTVAAIDSGAVGAGMGGPVNSGAQEPQHHQSVDQEDRRQQAAGQDLTEHNADAGLTGSSLTSGRQHEAETGSSPPQQTGAAQAGSNTAAAVLQGAMQAVEGAHDQMVAHLQNRLNATGSDVATRVMGIAGDLKKHQQQQTQTQTQVDDGRREQGDDRAVQRDDTESGVVSTVASEQRTQQGHGADIATQPTGQEQQVVAADSISSPLALPQQQQEQGNVQAPAQKDVEQQAQFVAGRKGLASTN